MFLILLLFTDNRNNIAMPGDVMSWKKTTKKQQTVILSGPFFEFHFWKGHFVWKLHSWHFLGMSGPLQKDRALSMKHFGKERSGTGLVSGVIRALSKRVGGVWFWFFSFCWDRKWACVCVCRKGAFAASGTFYNRMESSSALADRWSEVFYVSGRGMQDVIWQVYHYLVFVVIESEIMPMLIMLSRDKNPDVLYC